jgi:YbbR domain-containing protein
MEQVVEVRAILNISQASEDIDRNLQLHAYDKNGIFVEGIIITPDTVNAKMKIDQRGGYRNLIVKVVISGQVADFYSRTNISVNPPVVTVYSTDLQLIEELPGYIETQPIDLNGANEDIEVSLPLNLPSGVITVGESTVKVRVTVSPFEGSETFTISTIEVIGLSPELSVELSPKAVDVILSGPLPILESLKASDIRVILDLTDYDIGIHQVEPRVELDTSALSVESILPSVIEVTISIPPTSN